MYKPLVFCPMQHEHGKQITYFLFAAATFYMFEAYFCLPPQSSLLSPVNPSRQLIILTALLRTPSRSSTFFSK